MTDATDACSALKQPARIVACAAKAFAAYNLQEFVVLVVTGDQQSKAFNDPKLQALHVKI
jgi:hypothetical protein